MLFNKREQQSLARMYDWGMDFECVVYEYTYNPYEGYPWIDLATEEMRYLSLKEYNDWYRDYDQEGTGSDNIEDFNN